MIKELTDLLTAYANIPFTNQSILFAIIIILGILAFKFFDDRKFKKYYDDMKNEKNKEIERLADDNRRYRDLYLKDKGMTKKQIDKISATDMKGK